MCADIDSARSSASTRGEIPIFEHGLEDHRRGGRCAAGKLRFVARRGQRRRRVRDRLPLRADAAGRRRLGRPLLRRARPPGRSRTRCRASAIVVNKSTVPVGSTKVVERVLRRARRQGRVQPRVPPRGLGGPRLPAPRPRRRRQRRPGRGDHAWPSLYLGIAAPLIVTDPASAETIKYAANAFLATKLSFINAVAAICEAVGADVNDVVVGIGYDKRIGSEFLRPGPGWGGSCFPKDSRAMVKIAEDAGYDFDLLDGVIAVNDEQLDRVVDKIERAVGGELSGRRVARVGPDVQGRHRRPARVAGAGDHPAPDRPRRQRCGPTTRRSTVAPSDGIERLRRSRTPPATAPTCSPCSPSGTSSAGSTSARCATRMTAARSSTPATCSTARPRMRAGFTYQGVGR